MNRRGFLVLVMGVLLPAVPGLASGILTIDRCVYGGGPFTQNSSCSGTATPTLSDGTNGVSLVGAIGSLSGYDPNQVVPRDLPAFLFWHGQATGDFVTFIQIDWSFRGLFNTFFTWELDLDLPYSFPQTVIPLATGSGTGSPSFSGSALIPLNESLSGDWALILTGHTSYNRPGGSLTLTDAAITAKTIAPVAETPEPSTAILLALGIGVLALSRHRRIHKRKCAAAAVLCVAAAVAIAPAAEAATIFPLMPPTGYSNGEGVAINASGQIATTLYKGGFNSGTSTTALYSNGAFTDVAAGNGKGSGVSFAAGINDSGSQVGSYFPGVQSSSAFLISADGTLTNLKNLNTGVTSHGSQAEAINNAGTIVGSSYTSGNAAEHPASWNATGTVVTDLGTIAGGKFGAAFGINASGEIVGTAGASDNSLSNGKAFVYTAGHIAALTGVIGASDAYAVNNAGQIVGDETIGGNLHAFLDINNSARDLGTLGGATSAAYAINSLGQVVGYADTAAGSDAFLYSGGTMIDLNTLLPADSGWVLQVANGINDSGQVTGYGLFDGQQQAFLLNVTPEPSSIALSCLGLGLVVWIKFRSGRSCWIRGGAGNRVAASLRIGRNNGNDLSYGHVPHYRSRIRSRYPRRLGEGPGECRDNRLLGLTNTRCIDLSKQQFFRLLNGESLPFAFGFRNLLSDVWPIRECICDAVCGQYRRADLAEHVLHFPPPAPAGDPIRISRGKPVDLVLV